MVKYLDRKRSGNISYWTNIITARFPWVTALLFTLCVACGSCSSGRSTRAGVGRTGEQVCVPGQAYRYYHFPFILEYRYKGTLNFSVTCNEMEGTLVMDKDTDLLKRGIPYSGTGHIYAFPESEYLLYTIEIALPDATVDGCPEQGFSLAISLPTRPDNTSLSGALTAYCGLSTFQERPLKVMRISGLLEETAPP